MGTRGRASPVDDEDASRVEASPAAVISTPRSVASSSAGRSPRARRRNTRHRDSTAGVRSSGVRGDPIVRPALRRKHAARNHGGKHVPHIHAPDANARRGGQRHHRAPARVRHHARRHRGKSPRWTECQTDDVDRRRTTGASMMDDAFQPCTRRLVPRRAGVVRVRTSPRVPSPPPPSLPLPRVHSTMSSSSNTSLGSYCPSTSLVPRRLRLLFRRRRRARSPWPSSRMHADRSAPPPRGSPPSINSRRRERAHRCTTRSPPVPRRTRRPPRSTYAWETTAPGNP